MTTRCVTQQATAPSAGVTLRAEPAAEEQRPLPPLQQHGRCRAVRHHHIRQVGAVAGALQSSRFWSFPQHAPLFDHQGPLITWRTQLDSSARLTLELAALARKLDNLRLERFVVCFIAAVERRE
jgi:hypothetical protein